jgi:tRNA-splicing ligase RtcB
MSERTHEIFDVKGGVPVKAWTVGVSFEDQAREQLRRVASLPFVYRWVAAMPDVHAGMGATVGSAG